MPRLEFSLDEVPFSMRGSWLSVSRVTGLHTRSPHVHLVSHQTGMHPVLAVLVYDRGELLEALPAASPQAACDGTRHPASWRRSSPT
ncbi:hypothetical protein [Microbacterium elymi]|uniref:Uncharacterized protein n=1 Tax=Microbacterium elymi TaxID=2909587 RepID=A0ABY5NLL7_9MICO|nr:hypothetical protein [Microbacterium elymi]UUT36079.1 hypothetical protein L2X98_23670 [Microbacterium elymi]